LIFLLFCFIVYDDGDSDDDEENICFMVLLQIFWACLPLLMMKIKNNMREEKGRR